MKQTILSFIIFFIYGLFQLTWKIRIIESDSFARCKRENKSFCFSVWHGNELSTLFLPYFYKLAALVSQSKDGQLMTNILSWMGVKISRGSSSKGAISGLKALIRDVKNGRSCIFAVDGPKGPYHIIKPGIFETARLTKSGVFPTGVAVSSYWRLNKSWNKAIFPKPFAKIIIVVGDEFKFDSKLSPKSPDLGNDLKLLMHDAEQDALSLLAQF